MSKKIFLKAENFVQKIENSKVGLFSWIIFFLCFVFIRNFLESFSSINLTMVKSWPFFFLHSVFFYFFVVLSFLLASKLLTGERVEKVSRASLLTLPLLLLPPIFDKLILGSVTATKYSAWNFSSIGDVFSLFFKYILFGPFGILNFGPSIFSGQYSVFKDVYLINYGLRLELILVIFGFLLYIFLKTKSIKRVLGGFFLSYVILFIISHFPSLVSSAVKVSSFHSISSLNQDFAWNYVLFSLYFILSFLLSLIWFYFYNKKKLFAFLKNVRVPRMGLYLGAFGAGLYLARPSLDFNFFDWLLIAMASLSIIFSWLFAVGTNDIEDEFVDKISNPGRPLPSGKITRSEISSVNLILRIISYICAFVAGYAFFVTILVRSCISYLYSHEPFRLKRFPLVSTFCIASSVLLGVMGGFLLSSSNTIYSFPGRLIPLVLIAFTFSMNVIHIKDYEGDKKEGVWTFLVIFGLENGKLITAFLSAISIMTPVFIFPELARVLFWPSAVCALLSYFLIIRKNFKEWLVILLYYFYAAPVIIFISVKL